MASDWLAALLTWSTDNHFGDLSGLLGVLVSIVGFAITIFNVVRSKSAAALAAKAARDIKDAISFYDAVADVAAAVAALEEIQRHLRSGNWDILPDRYTALRKLLITVRARNPHVTNGDKVKIQEVMTTVSALHETLEKARGRTKPSDIGRNVHLLSNSIDSLHSILVDLHARASGETDGQ